MEQNERIMFSTRHLKRLSIVLLAGSVTLLLLAACGGDEEDTSPASTARPATTAPPAQANLSGQIAISGSSTVFPISEAVAEEFSKLYSGVRTNVASTGTGAGGRAMCEQGTIQVWDASRPATQSEIDKCLENGIELIELPVAFDALSVVVSLENDYATCLSVEELETVFGPDAEGTITDWSQVRDGFPDSRLRIYGPTTSSGTFDYFTEAIMGESGAHRGDLDLATEEDPLIAQGVNGTPGGIGYFGLAYLTQYQTLVNAVAIKNPTTGECVLPSSESVESGRYLPLARPIFIYVRKDQLDERPEVKAFVDFYIEQATNLVSDVGYVALPPTAYDWGQGRVDNSVTGSIFNTIKPGTPLEEALAKVE